MDQQGVPVADPPGLASVAPAPRSRKGGPKPVPERQEVFAHLTLESLRAYRRALGEEESRVSYWRRILQARLDLLRAALDGTSARDVDTEALRPVLTDARVGAGRQALVAVVPVDDIPPLPRIEQLWERQVDPADEPAARELEADLARAERELSDYRAALHRRIAAATGELIARYREQPSLCLSVLPLPAERVLAAG
ncbi:MAG TPA: hypothetical protein VNU26_13240 [Mycobacteriales bacterium]|nr:hypothetical protein [Mycobacteriales bacterium]